MPAQQASPTSASHILRILLTAILPLAVFCWPFLFFYPFVTPVDGHSYGIGNDFYSVYYLYKPYLLAELNNLRIPLWSPSEAGGFPFYSSPFPQVFYPLNLPLAVFYRLAGGYSPLDHQRYAVLAIAIFTLGLFFWLKQFRFGLRAALFAALIMGVSFKTAENLRFVNGAHAAAWYPWVLFSITRIFQSPGRRERWLAGLLLAFSLVCLFTAGYPYFIYYSLFLFAPYLLLFVVPGLRRVLLEQPGSGLRQAFGAMAAAAAGAVVVCAPYLYKMWQLLQQTTDRAGNTYAFAVEYGFSFEDTLGSLVFPPAAQAEGWYYFGGLGLLLIALYLFAPLGGAHRDGDAPPANALAPKVFFVAWVVVISYITYGKESYLFTALWKWMPFFSSLRVWGRLNIILVPLIAWLMAAGWNHFEDLLRRSAPTVKGRAGAAWGRSLALLTIVYLAVLALQAYFYLNQRYDPFWGRYFASTANPYTPLNLLVGRELLFILFGAAGFLLLLLLLFLAAQRALNSPAVLNIILATLVLFTAIDLAANRYGAWIGEPPKQERTLLNPALNTRLSIGIPRSEVAGISHSKTFSLGVFGHWYFERYNRFLGETDAEVVARRELLGWQDGRRFFFSESIQHPTIRSFLEDANRYNGCEKVIRYSGSYLELEVEAPLPGYISFIDNWDPDWEAALDGQPAPIELLFGAFKALRVPAGSHRLEFSYRPQFFRSFSSSLGMGSSAWGAPAWSDAGNP